MVVVVVNGNSTKRGGFVQVSRAHNHHGEQQIRDLQGRKTDVTLYAIVQWMHVTISCHYHLQRDETLMRETLSVFDSI